jgi:EAL domain-containing protein (putative c-di-GMP-specific phosphodiesterase class I)
VPASHSTDYLRAIAESMGEELRLGWSQASRVAAVSLAGGFGQQTVAEGVEGCATVNLLCDLAVDYGEGYALGRPAPAESLLSGRHHR